jgi:glycosyltransferase involved in cell wall biosynthesis
MKKCLVIVKNIFVNDARVNRACCTLVQKGLSVQVIAEKSSKGLPIYEVDGYSVIRVPVFSSLYSRRYSNRTSQVFSQNRRNLISSVLGIIKKNKARKNIVSELNSICFNVQTVILGILFRPDVIIANDLETLTAGFVLKKIMRCKLIYDSHEIWLEGNTFHSASIFKQKYWKYLESILISKVDHVSVTTNYRAHYLKCKYNLSSIQVIRNCPSFRQIDKRKIFHDEYHLPKNVKVVLYQGLIDRQRGVFTMVDVVSEISDVVLILLGRGQDKNSLQEYIEEMRMSNKVFIKDEVPHSILLDYTAAADVGLQLLKNTGINHYSTISNKIFEYFLAEIAILGSDFPEIKKIIQENKIGLVVDPSDTNNIKKQLTLLLQDSKLNEIRDNYKRISNKYSWKLEEYKLVEIVET